jgi:signal transduction histidine kinase
MAAFGGGPHEELLDLYDKMVGAKSLDEAFVQVRRVLCETMDAEAATVYLVRKETRELEAHVPVHNVMRTIKVPILTSSIAGCCAKTARPLLIPDAYDDLSPVHPDLHFDRSWDEAHGHRTRDVMCAPALCRGEVVGVVQVLNSKASGCFDRDDLDVLTKIARMVGYVLYHAKVFDDLRSMKQLQKEKAKFIRVMVHELKSPVSAARMLLDLLIRDMVGPEMRAELLDRIRERLEALLATIKDTLDLARLESGDPLGKVEEVKLHECIKEVCTPFRDEAKAKGLVFKVKSAAQDPVLRIDTTGLRLILTNLVGNAIKYTEAGNVEVRIEDDEARVIVHVVDSGMGIPEEDVPKLFTEFYRASNARASSIEGTGVGLAGVKRLVERFGGELRLQTVQDEGSTFSVVLPLATDETLPVLKARPDFLEGPA